MTAAEKYLWPQLKKKRLGYWFYRQKPVGIYIADFYCPHAKLVVEVDGRKHLSRDTAEYDKARDEFMQSIGLRVIRFKNEQVLTNIEAVIDEIKRRIE